ncbi:MAG: glucose 1-dehydrogenase [bacterium]
MKFENKVAIVTGASKGIGKATAILLAQEGARVVINYLESEEDANSAVDEIMKNGSDAIAIRCDVSKEEDVQKMIDQTVDHFGSVDILINNAGVVFDTPLFEKTVEQWRRTLDVNLIGTFLCSKYAGLQMLKQTGGKIINVSSTNAINCFSPDALDYDASKAGVITLTKDFAKELAPKIQVNAVAPGWVNTEMNKDLPADFVAKETDKIYLKRFAEPEEIAKTISFLASSDADYITGSVLVVDGGY